MQTILGFLKKLVCQYSETVNRERAFLYDSTPSYDVLQ